MLHLFLRLRVISPSGKLFLLSPKSSSPNDHDLFFAPVLRACRQAGEVPRWKVPGARGGNQGVVLSGMSGWKPDLRE